MQIIYANDYDFEFDISSASEVLQRRAIAGVPKSAHVAAKPN